MRGRRRSPARLVDLHHPVSLGELDAAGERARERTEGLAVVGAEEAEARPVGERHPGAEAELGAVGRRHGRQVAREADRRRLDGLARHPQRALASHGVVVHTLDEALASELVRAREMVVEVEQPGAGPVSLLGVPVKLGSTPGGAAGPGPALGEHTDAVLAEFGIDATRCAALRQQGAIA